MLTNPTIETLKSLKQHGMIEALEEQQQTPAVQALSFEERIALIVDRERLYRDNQRRSRARHKEYVEDIKRKLLDLEERGVQATVEVQQAARKVAEENRLLRELLACKGVCQQEVDEFLRISRKRSIGDAVYNVKCQLPDQLVGGPGSTEHLSTVAGPKPSSIPPSTCSSAPGTGSPRPCNRTDDTSPPSSDLPNQSRDQHELVLRSTQ